jgi:predicted MFS family arabinose efflux permease
MSTGLGTSTVSIYGGYLIAAQGFQTLWLSAALIALFALVLIWASQRWQHIDSPTLSPLIEKE